MPQPEGLDLAVDLDLDLDLDFAPADDLPPDPLADYQYTGDVEVDSAAEVAAVKTGFVARAQQEERRRAKAVDSEYWFCVCFQSREQVLEFLQKSKWGTEKDKYLDGQKVAKALGIKLTPDTTGFGQVRPPDKKWTSLAMEV